MFVSPAYNRVPEPAFVYFIQAGDERGHIKIGYSANVDRRLESLQTGNHLPLRVLAKYQHANAPAVERQLHAEFADLRTEGEWFKFDDSIMRCIHALNAIANDGFTQEALTWFPTGVAPGQIKLAFPDYYVVEWSNRDGCIHIGTLSEAMKLTRNSFLNGRGNPVDYVIVAVLESWDDANKLAAAIEPRLKAHRFARLLLEGER